MSIRTICNPSWLRLWLVCWLASAVCGSARATPAQEARAVKAAQNWVRLVDASKYRDAWLEGSSVLRQGVNVDTFASGMSSVRHQLGALVSRSVSAHHLVNRLPGAPPGKYVVMEFKTRFVHRATTERVTLMLEGDGKWRVSGYYFV